MKNINWENVSDSALMLLFNMGMSIAIVLSWSINNSIYWTAVHGAMGWFYVIYHWWVYQL